MEILTNVQLLLCPDGDAVSFTGADQAITMELASAEIEDHIGVEMLPVEAGLKMEMGAGRTSGIASQSDWLTSLHYLISLYQEFRKVPINRL